MSKMLNPTVAERIVDTIRRRHGLGDAYHLDVSDNGDGTWTVVDGKGRETLVPPMDETRWRRWFDRRYGDVIQDRLETSEG